MSVDLVVLLGAPTSGKTTVGRLLGARYGWGWREWEVELLREWGDRDNLIANKAAALTQLHERIHAMAAAPGLPVVYESTGLSDGAYLDGHTRSLACATVRLDVGEQEMLRRFRARARGEHLTDSESLTRRIWSEFTSVVVPTRAVDLVIDTEAIDPERACELIHSHVDDAARGQSRS